MFFFARRWNGPTARHVDWLEGCHKAGFEPWSAGAPQELGGVDGNGPSRKVENLPLTSFLLSLYVPTANLLGFNLWGRGVVTRKRASLKIGTVLEPCWNEPCWNHAGTLLEASFGTAGADKMHALENISGTLPEPRWNLLATLVKPCLNRTGALLLEPLVGTSCWEPMWVSISFSFYVVSCFADECAGL